MTIFELYSANVPLLVPDASLLRKLGCVASLAHYGGGASYDRPCRGGARPWSQLGSAASVDFFLKRADFYDDAHPDGMPHVHTFRSMEDLGKQLAAIDTRKTSAAMKETNCLRACRVRKSAWTQRGERTNSRFGRATSAGHGPNTFARGAGAHMWSDRTPYRRPPAPTRTHRPRLHARSA